MEAKRTALVLCPLSPHGYGTTARLAGLTVGERVLLALSFEGVERVAFLGPGPQPASDRARIEVFQALVAPPEDLGEDFLVLTADLVFDRTMLRAGDAPDGDLPMRRLDASAWRAVVADPDGWIELLHVGRATSGRRFGIRVLDRESARAAERALLLSLRKPIDGFVSRHLNRYISLFVSKHLVRTGVRPNAVTVFIMLFGIGAGLAAAVARPWWMLVLAGALFQLQSILDGCDGEIARLTYRFSRAGQWLDTLGDDTTNWLFTFGLAFGQARALGLPWLYAAGGVIVFAQLWSALLMYQRIIRMGTGDLLALPNLVTGPPPSGAWGKAVKALHVASKKDTFTLVAGVVTAAGLPWAAFGLIAFGSLGMAYGLTVNEHRIRRIERRTGELYRG